MIKNIFDDSKGLEALCQALVDSMDGDCDCHLEDSAYELLSTFSDEELEIELERRSLAKSVKQIEDSRAIYCALDSIKEILNENGWKLAQVDHDGPDFGFQLDLEKVFIR